MVVVKVVVVGVTTIAEMVVFWNDKITFEEKGGLMSKLMPKLMLPAGYVTARSHVTASGRGPPCHELLSRRAEAIRQSQSPAIQDPAITEPSNPGSGNHRHWQF